MWLISTTNWNFPHFSPGETGGRKAREISIRCRNCSQGSYSHLTFPLRIFVPCKIKVQVAKIVLFPGVPHCKPYKFQIFHKAVFPTASRWQSCWKNYRGQPEKGNHTSFRKWYNWLLKSYSFSWNDSFNFHTKNFLWKTEKVKSWHWKNDGKSCWAFCTCALQIVKLRGKQQHGT